MYCGFRLCIFLLLVQVISASFNLTVLHTNDVHSRFEETSQFGGLCSEKDRTANKCVGGASRRATKIKELRNSRKNVLLLDGGDQFQGTFWFHVFKGEIVSRVMKLLGYDAMALGNHEFDEGLDVLQQFISNVSTSVEVLSSNIDNSNEPRLSGYKSYNITEVNGRKIGIIGYTTKDTKVLTSFASTGRTVFNDEVVSVSKAVEDLLQEDSTVNIIIAVGHAGFAMDQRVAKEIDRVDIVVGGHTNTFLYTGTPPSNEKPAGDYPFVVEKTSGKKALVVQAFYFSKYLGDLQVSFDDNGELLNWSGNPILLDNNVTKDAEMEAVLAPYAQQVEARGNVPVGQTNVFLQGDTTYCRLQECNMGNLITDAIIHTNIEFGTDVKWAKAAIAVVNAGSIRSPIAKGNITFADIMTTMPFGNTIDAVVLRGDTVKAMFERSVEFYNPVEAVGGFLQVSGVHVTYDICRPVGQRVVELRLRCLKCDTPSYLPVDVTAEYTILTSSFTASGGDNYDMVANDRLSHENLGMGDSSLVMEYLDQMEIVYPAEESRIRFLNKRNETHVICENSINASSAQPVSSLAVFITALISIAVNIN